MPKKVATTKVKTAKKVAKKVTKSTKAADSKKALVYADNKKSFWLKDGQILNSLVALQEAFDSMEKAVYQHHVNTDKHDFADWVDAVLSDSDCAEDLRKSKTPTSAKTVVTKHLKAYKV